MTAYRKRPVIVEAIQWTGSNQAAVSDFMGNSPPFNSNADRSWVQIETLEGVMSADCGWWIIKGIKGEFYPCRDDIFVATYEAVE